MPAEPGLWDLDQQATHPFLQAHALPVPRPPVRPKRPRGKKGTPAPSRKQARAGSRETTYNPPAPAPPSPPSPAGTSPNPPCQRRPGVLMILSPTTGTVKA